jgi:hypothetical protein
MVPWARISCCPRLRPRALTVRRHDGRDGRAGVKRGAAGLVLVDVRAVVEEDRVRGLGKVRAERDLVAHRARRQEERGLLAGDAGHVYLERLRARLVVDVVARARARGVRVHLLRRRWRAVSGGRGPCGARDAPVIVSAAGHHDQRRDGEGRAHGQTKLREISSSWRSLSSSGVAARMSKARVSATALRAAASVSCSVLMLCVRAWRCSGRWAAQDKDRANFERHSTAAAAPTAPAKLSQKQMTGPGTGGNAWENRGRLCTGCQRAPCRAVCTACAVFLVSPQRVHVFRPARPSARRLDSCTSTSTNTPPPIQHGQRTCSPISPRFPPRDAHRPRRVQRRSRSASATRRRRPRARRASSRSTRPR